MPPAWTPTVVAKLEYMNPGGSVKDRIGLPMIEAAEREGLLRPGGTIVEPTSGNTGVGLAMAAAIKGYRCIFVMPDKMSHEKIALLRAYGAEVIICPTAVEPESPESYYSVSTTGWPRRSRAHSSPTSTRTWPTPRRTAKAPAPEIWEQTNGELDALVVALGTGGTLSGTAGYLKERKPDLLVVGADPEGSIYSQPDDVHPYLVEGIGEDFYPQTMDLSLIDEYVTVSDRDSFLAARRMAREEGMLVGGSAGTAVHAALQVAGRLGGGATVVTLVPDSGRAYLSKFYDDNYMLEHGFVERAAPAPTVAEVLRHARREHAELPGLVVIEAGRRIGEAIQLMQRYSISQLPVVRQSPAESFADIMGSLHERSLLDRVFRHPDALEEDVVEAMQPPLATVEDRESVDRVFADLTRGSPAVVVAHDGRPAGMLTRSDLLEYLADRRNGS